MIRRLFFCLLFLPGVLFAQSGYPVGSSNRIAGVIIDATSNTPIPHAELTISNNDNSDEAQVFSADDGRFVFQNVAPGKYPLFASAPGYIREGFNEHSGLLTAIAVGTGVDAEHLIFRLHRQSILVGRVTDERSEAVRNAQIMLFSTKTRDSRRETSVRSQASTNDLGEYRFAALSPGKYFVAVSARPWYAQSGLNFQPEPEPPSGSNQLQVFIGSQRRLPHSDPSLDVVYPITLYPGVTDEQAASEITLASRDKFDANIQLQPVPAVHLRLTNLSTDAQEPSSIEVKQKLFGFFPVHLTPTVAQISPGEMEVTDIPAGELSLNITQGSGDNQRSHTITTLVSSGDGIDASASGNSANVSGRVVFADGYAGPVRGQIFLYLGNTPDYSAVLRKGGTFSFPPIPPGSYTMLANVYGANPEFFTDHIAATGAKSTGREISISGSGEVQLTVTLNRGLGQVIGVALLDGKPAAGIMVLLVPATGQSLEADSRIDQSDSDGTFSLSNIRPGDYLALALDNAWDLDRSDWSALTPYLGKAAPIHVSIRDHKIVTLTVQLATTAATSPSNPTP